MGVVFFLSALILPHLSMSVSLEKEITKLIGLERKYPDGFMLDGVPFTCFHDVMISLLGSSAAECLDVFQWLVLKQESSNHSSVSGARGGRAL